MTRKHRFPSNGIEPNSPKRKPRGDEEAHSHSDPFAPVNDTEAAEDHRMRDGDPSGEDDHSANDALMESYNG